MPWKEVDTVDLRREFVRLAGSGSLDMSALCQRYGVSRKTGYKWLWRYAREGDQGLLDRSRCPHHQPRRSPSSVEQIVLGLRQRYPDWGGRKLGGSGTVGVDFKELSAVPVGIRFAFSSQPIDQGGTGPDDDIRSYGVGVFYTGRPDLSIGADAIFLRLPLIDSDFETDALQASIGHR